MASTSTIEEFEANLKIEKEAKKKSLEPTTEPTAETNEDVQTKEDETTDNNPNSSSEILSSDEIKKPLTQDQINCVSFKSFKLSLLNFIYINI